MLQAILDKALLCQEKEIGYMLESVLARRNLACVSGVYIWNKFDGSDVESLKVSQKLNQRNFHIQLL